MNESKFAKGSVVVMTGRRYPESALIVDGYDGSGNRGRRVDLGRGRPKEQEKD